MRSWRGLDASFGKRLTLIEPALQDTLGPAIDIQMTETSDEADASKDTLQCEGTLRRFKRTDGHGTANMRHLRHDQRPSFPFPP